MESQGPFESSHPEPLAQAGSGNLQKTAELAAVAALLSQAAGQVRARRAGRSADELARQDAALAADGAAKTAARANWEKARQPEWLADATLHEAAYAWGSALPYEHAEPGAAVALDLAERRLGELHPHAMRIYDRHRQDGLSREDAMRATAPEFDKSPRARPAPRDAQRDLYLPLAGPGAGGGEDWVLQGPDARAAHHILGIIRRYQDQAAAAGEGPLSARAIKMALMQRTNIKKSLASAILQGLGEGDHVVPPAARPGGARSVSQVGVAANDWPESGRAAVAVTAIRKAAGGQPRSKARSRSGPPAQGSSPRLHP